MVFAGEAHKSLFLTKNLNILPKILKILKRNSKMPKNSRFPRDPCGDPCGDQETPDSGLFHFQLQDAVSRSWC